MGFVCALLLDPFIQSAPTKGLLCARQSVRAQREPHQPGGEREVKTGGRFLEGVTPVLILKQQIRNRQAKKGGGDDDQKLCHEVSEDLVILLPWLRFTEWRALQT